MKTAIPALVIVIVALIAVATALSIPIVAYNNPTFARTNVVIWYQTPTIVHTSSFIAVPVGISAYIGTGASGDIPRPAPPPGNLADLRKGGYFLLPLPAQRKEPPPEGWTERTDPYDITTGGNVAVGARGEICILITNDEAATEWATRRYGAPNVRSRRGGHWYFRGGDGWSNLPNTETAAGTMELHVHNKYALIPPSIHPSGVPYTWERPLPPIAELPPCPTDLRALWSPNDPEPAPLREDLSGIEEQVVRAVSPHWKPGVRWQLTKAIAGFARKYLRLDETGARALIQRIAVTAGDRDSLDREKKIPYTFRLEPKRVGVGYWLQEAGVESLGEELFGILRREGTAARDLWIRRTRPDGTEEVVPNRAEFEDRLLEERRFLSLRDSRELRIYSEERGFYILEADTFVAQWVRERFAEQAKTASTAFIHEVVATVRDRSYRERSEVNPPWEVVVENGVLDVKTGHLRPHTPEPPFTVGLPVPFEPDAKCPRFEKFLEQALPNHETRDAILEFSGYLLWPWNSLRKMLVLWGPSTTGKSTFTAVLNGVYGTDNIAAIDLSGLADDKFLAAEIADKIANVRSDIPWKLIRNVGLVQELTGGRDEISAQRKYQHPFKFRPSAKLVFSCNRLPRVPGATPAFWVRILLVAWEVKVEPKDERPDFAAELLEERAGIFRTFFDASRRLLKQGRFTALPVDIADKWVRSSDPALWVAEHELVDDPEGEVALDDVVKRVDEVAEEENVEEPPSPREVAAAIRRAHPRVSSERRGKEKRTFLRGVKARVTPPPEPTHEGAGRKGDPPKPPGDVPPPPSIGSEAEVTPRRPPPQTVRARLAHTAFSASSGAPLEEDIR